jgi:hypothetical protein
MLQGIAFCEYADNDIVDAVIEGLNEITLGDGNLKVSRATVGVQQTAGLDGGVGAISMLASATADNLEHSRVVCLMNMVTSDELISNEDYEGKNNPSSKSSFVTGVPLPTHLSNEASFSNPFHPVCQMNLPLH